MNEKCAEFGLRTRLKPRRSNYSARGAKIWNEVNFSLPSAHNIRTSAEKFAHTRYDDIRIAEHIHVNEVPNCFIHNYQEAEFVR